MLIYTYPKSRSLRVLWLMEELGESYQTERVDLTHSESGTRSPDPAGRVPFLVDGEVKMSETVAICIYICEKIANNHLYSTEPVIKAKINRWLSFTLTDLESPVWGLLKLLVFTPQALRSPDLIQYFTNEANRAIAMIARPKSQAWISGKDFTLADIFLCHTLYWAKLSGLELGPVLLDYIDRAISRPAFILAQLRNDH